MSTEQSIIQNTKRRGRRDNMFEDYDPEKAKDKMKQYREKIENAGPLSSADIQFIQGVVGMWKDNGKDVASLIGGIEQVSSIEEDIDRTVEEEDNKAERKRKQETKTQSSSSEKMSEEELGQELDNMLQGKS